MIFLVILVRNDQESLPPFLAAVQVASTEWDQPHQALVVNDGSSDETASIVRDFGQFDLLSQPNPVGEGAALRIGLGTALKRAEPADIIVTLDARIIHCPALVKGMLPLIGQGFDVVLATRYTRGGGELGLSSAQVLVNKASAWLMNRLFSIAGVQDYTNRCRAHRAGVLLESASLYQDQLIEEGDSACWVEILLKLARLEQIRFTQIPHVVRYDLQPMYRQDGVWQSMRRQARLISRGRRHR